jgi:N-acyl-D-aspartate/D-glutamate deacylase
VLLRGGLVVDGTGHVPPYPADLVIRGDRIDQIVDRRGEDGSSQAPVGAPVLDCRGAIVAPGFVDVHTHSDLTWLYYPECTSRVTQGITTEVIGNCGMSPAPFAANDANFRQTISVIDQEPARPFGWATYSGYLEVLSEHRAATNVVPFVGHGSARQMVLSGSGTGPGDALAPSQVAEVVDLVRQALQLGAWGLSFGLMYSPGEGASFAELMSVASEVQRQDAVLSVHMRSYEAANIQHAIEEMVRIQSGCGVALELSHLRVLRAENSAVVERCLELLDSAGDEVHADAYPYEAGQTTLFQLLAPSDRSRGVAAMLARLSSDRPHYARSVAHAGYSPDQVIVVRTEAPEDAAAVGRSLGSLADESGMDWPDVALDLLGRSNGYVDVVVFGSKMPEQELILQHKKVMVGSDGWVVPRQHSAAVHPRAFGAFPKALRLLTDGGTPWEVAIAKATGAPARKIGLTNRGVLCPGAVADITVLEPDSLLDMASYAEPFAPARGIRHVLVAGVAVVQDTVTTPERPGRALLR